MTIATTVSEVEYTADGTAFEFAVPFKFNDDADLVVRATPDGGTEVTLVLGVHYSVDGAGEDAGGTVDFGELTPPDDDTVINITRNVDITQEVDLSIQGAFDPETLEGQFDKLTTIDQQLSRRIGVIESAGELGDMVAGAGLTLSGDVLAVGAGTGIIVGADTVGLNFAVTTPANVTKAAASAGAGTTAARIDHKHDISTAAAATITTANAEGSASSLARSDHTHDHGALLGGDRHAVATTSVAGFLAAADKTRIAGALANVTRLFRFAAPAAKSVTACHAAFAGNDASNAFPGPFANPVIPRNISVTFGGAWDGGSVTVTGTDQYDAAVSEVIAAAAGTTAYGAKIFKTVTSAVKGAVGSSSNTASIGTGDKLGIIANVVDAFGLLLVDDVAEAVTVDATYDGFTPTTAPNGTKNFKILVNL